jgi:hypothetical protein
MKPPDYELLPTLKDALSGVVPNKLILSLLLFLLGAPESDPAGGQ